MSVWVPTYSAFVDAGLPEPALEGTALVGCSAGWPGYQYVADSVESVLPLLEEYGIATSEEAAVKTLPERLRKEVMAAKSPAILPLNIITDGNQAVSFTFHLALFSHVPQTKQGHHRPC